MDQVGNNPAHAGALGLRGHRHGRIEACQSGPEFPLQSCDALERGRRALGNIAGRGRLHGEVIDSSQDGLGSGKFPGPGNDAGMQRIDPIHRDAGHLRRAGLVGDAVGQ